MFEGVLSDKLSFSSYSKDNVFLKLPFFELKETLTLLTMLVKTIYCKTENNTGKYYHSHSQQKLRKFQQFQLPAVFNFH